MELEQAMENRRSIRKYEAKPVETEKIRKMIQAAGLAPSWKNSQVTRYYVAQSEEAVAKVREALPEFNRNNTENALWGFEMPKSCGTCFTFHWRRALSV